MTKYDTKTTPELRDGDIVQTHGMRVLIDGPMATAGARAGTFYRAGLVLNPDEVEAAGVVPMSWLFSDGSTEPRWTIQGNELARWAVERS